MSLLPDLVYRELRPPYYRKSLRRRDNPLIVKFLLSFCSLSKLLLVWPSSPKKKPDTIQLETPDYKGPLLDLWKKMEAHIELDRYTSSRYRRTPLRLGLWFKPDSGPNTHMRPGKDTHELLKRTGPSVWLPVDAAAFLGQFDPFSLNWWDSIFG